MNVTSIGNSSYLYEMSRMNSQTQESAETRHTKPHSLTKDELVEMADKMKSFGDSAADLFNLAIEEFNSTDTNQDGKISFDEMQVLAKANGLTMPQPQKPAGMAGMPPAMAEEELSGTQDQTESSGGSLVDLVSLVTEQFDAADTNEDGVVSLEEMLAYAKTRGTTMSQPQAQELAGMGGMQPPAMTKEELSEMLEQMEASGNSDTELLSLAIEQFDSADSDKDGKISFAEMQSFAKANNLSMPSPGANGPKPPEDMLFTGSSSDDSSDEELETLLNILQQNSIMAYSAYAASTGNGAFIGTDLLV